MQWNITIYPRFIACRFSSRLKNPGITTSAGPKNEKNAKYSEGSLFRAETAIKRISGPASKYPISFVISAKDQNIIIIRSDHNDGRIMGLAITNGN